MTRVNDTALLEVLVPADIKAPRALSTSAARTDFPSSATLRGSSEQELRPNTCAMQQRNRYFLHEKYAIPSWRIVVDKGEPVCAGPKS
jgi:hypothetical protein